MDCEGAAGDEEALVALYRSTNGAIWARDTHWTDARFRLSMWLGVHVADNAPDLSRVVSLKLSDCGIEGQLPAAMGKLTSLERCLG